MIENDQELQTTQERIAQFHQWLMQIRRTARPDEFDAVTSGYRLEIERMQAWISTNGRKDEKTKGLKDSGRLGSGGLQQVVRLGNIFDPHLFACWLFS